MLNLHLLECTLKGYDHISDLLLAKYWVITGCKYQGCKSLSNIYCKATNPPSLSSYAFYYISSERTFYVPTESVWLYQTTKWKSYANDIVGYDFE